MIDPYKTLGVNRDSSESELKSAYRKLAKKYHPDANPGDKAAEQRFKDVSHAYSLLRDPEKRKRFDQGEIDANGQERGFAGAGGFRGASAGGGGHPFGENFRPEDLFAEIFGRQRTRRQGARPPRRSKGKDLAGTARISFMEAAKGCKKRVRASEGRTLEVRIPPGTQDGQTLRLKGQGELGHGGGAAGDVTITIEVTPHKFFTNKGLNIYLEVPITLQEALLGAEIKVPTIDGKVTMKVPVGSNSGTTLRLKNKGLESTKGGTRGDQYVKLKIVLPDKPDHDLNNFVKTWAKTNEYDPRKKAGLEDS